MHVTLVRLMLHLCSLLQSCCGDHDDNYEDGNEGGDNVIINHNRYSDDGYEDDSDLLLGK